MWKIAVGFIAFALLSLFVIMQGGDKIDMQGESAGHNPTEVAEPAHDAASTTTTTTLPAASK